MHVGDVSAATLIVASSSHYCLNQIQIDGSTSNITTSWIGGSAPSAAIGSDLISTHSHYENSNSCLSYYRQRNIRCLIGGNKNVE